MEVSSLTKITKFLHYTLYGNLPLTSTLHSMMRYLIVSSFPTLTASPSGVSPSLATAPIVVSQRLLGMYEALVCKFKSKKTKPIETVIILPLH